MCVCMKINTYAINYNVFSSVQNIWNVKKDKNSTCSPEDRSFETSNYEGFFILFYISFFLHLGIYYIALHFHALRFCKDFGIKI